MGVDSSKSGAKFFVPRATQPRSCLPDANNVAAVGPRVLSDGSILPNDERKVVWVLEGIVAGCWQMPHLCCFREMNVHASEILTPIQCLRLISLPVRSSQAVEAGVCHEAAE